MAETKETRNLDPYKNFKFRVQWDGKTVAGLSKMSALKRTTEVIEWREAGASSVIHKLPGRTKFEPITLEAGVSDDVAFQTWANLVNHKDDAATSTAFRKELLIEVLDIRGNTVLSFDVHNAWVSEFQALPDMDANANAVAIAHIKIEHEGFEPSTPSASR